MNRAWWNRHTPNLLSSLRIALALLFPFIPDMWRLPVVVLSLCSEFFDGFLARRWNAVTSLGQILDPVADKLFVLSTVGVLIHEGLLTWFHFTLVAMRDIVVAGGVLSVLSESRDEAIRFLRPRISGKIATTLQFVFLLSLFATGRLIWPLFFVTAVVSCASGLDYLYVVLHRRFDPIARSIDTRTRVIRASS